MFWLRWKTLSGSQCCFHCGHIADTMPLDVRTWDCPACGTQGIDRDIKAARNILQAGKATTRESSAN
ncbi:transposase [Halomonas cerina]|uniref:Transposase n=1 Tax=Halomonas cerina TaxID=447424 RepID=A0A839VBM6_9GAMM|nr:transposase [Halomonas cerina]